METTLLSTATLSSARLVSLRTVSGAGSLSSLTINVTFIPKRSPHRRCRMLKVRRRSNFSVWNAMNCVADSGIVRGGNAEGYLEVINIGGRMDAVMDLCLSSPFQSNSSLRYWIMDSANSTLREQRIINGSYSRTLDIKQFLDSPFKALIIVASAGYGLDHEIIINILESIKARNIFTGAIFLKPFNFEGQRRQDEMNSLIVKVRELTSFCIDIDTDQLLKNDLVTLDEALKAANTAVLLSLNTISVLFSDIYQKILHERNNEVKDIEVYRIIEIMEQYNTAKIGFGISEDIRSSIFQAFYDCPFIGSSLERFNGIIFCVISSSCPVDNDLDASLLEVYETAKFGGDILFSCVQEPNLESNTFVTTLFVLGFSVQNTRHNDSIISRLSQCLPFFSNLFGEKNNKSDSDKSETVKRTHGENVEASNDNVNDIKNFAPEMKRSDVDVLVNGSEINVSDDYENEGPLALQRELGPGYQISQKWANERAGIVPAFDNTWIVSLPVGVKPPGYQNSHGSTINNEGNDKQAMTEKKIFKLYSASKVDDSSWDTLADAGLEAVKDLCASASSILKSKSEGPKRQGVLSVRAASMLEAERRSPMKWNPVVEMQFRGGTYRGRCQGGLPEGKGTLTLLDGSVYDGMWRYGKRSGHGTFYFGNGDVFHGYWREDLMHGKGWYYFHTGDRWFADFWKGRANGESRFYSKVGDIFFGHFQDGWRHGDFLCIRVDGSRLLETWDDGVLVASKFLDSESDADADSVRMQR